MDAMYPKTVALSNVKFDATHEYEFVNNFKVLQKAFDKVGITKVGCWSFSHFENTYVRQVIDVPKLVKAKHLDNLEFLQWFKRYFDDHYVEGEVPYKAKEVREKIKKAKALEQVNRRKSVVGMSWIPLPFNTS